MGHARSLVYGVPELLGLRGDLGCLRLRGRHPPHDVRLGVDEELARGGGDRGGEAAAGRELGERQRIAAAEVAQEGNVVLHLLALVLDNLLMGV